MAVSSRGPLIATLAILATLAPAVALAGDCVVYTVQPGDWCDKIAGSHNITTPDLVAFNPTLDCTKLSVGQKVCTTNGTIPLPPSNPDGTCREHKVESGQWCNLIAEQNKLTLDELLKLNLSLKCEALAVGQRLCVSLGKLKSNRPPKNADGSCHVYKVQAGDSCSAIGGRFDVSVDEIEQWNKGKTWKFGGCHTIVPDMKVCVSEGTAPLPDTNPALQCGMESVGNKTCPLNTCCSSSGYCGTTAEFCIVDPSGVPGSGCQSGCGMLPPPSAFQCQDTMRYSVGYYQSWAENRACHVVKVEDLDTTAYTHMIYSFASIDAQHRLSLDTSNQTDQLHRFVQHVHRPSPQNTKAMIAVGGYAFNDAGPTQSRFTDMLATKATRATFIRSAIQFLQRFNLDGLDFDYEYPSAPDRGGRPQDAENYLALVREMRKAVGDRYTISMAAPSGFWYLQGYKYAEMAPYLDFTLAMTYDYHGTWDWDTATKSGVMLAHTNVTRVVDGLNLALKAGVPSNKILLGLGFYGRAFRQADLACDKAGCPFADPVAVGGAEVGTCTAESGILGYMEIDDMVRSKEYRSVQAADGASWTAGMAYGNGSWVGYDTPVTIQRRVQFAKEKCLGGVGVWSVDTDSKAKDLSNVIAVARGIRPPPSSPCMEECHRQDRQCRNRCNIQAQIVTKCLGDCDAVTSKCQQQCHGAAQAGQRTH